MKRVVIVARNLFTAVLLLTAMTLTIYAGDSNLPGGGGSPPPPPPNGIVINRDINAQPTLKDGGDFSIFEWLFHLVRH